MINIGIKIKKKSKKIYKNILVLMAATLVINPTIVAAATLNISFEESTSQKETKSISLPSNFDSVTSISADNGEVSYAVNNGQLNVTVDNGTPISSDSVFNPTKYQKSGETYLFSDTNVFPDTTPYSDESGYSGDIGLTGNPYVVEGSLLPGSIKTVTESLVSSDPSYLPTVYDYNYNGYTGTLSKNGSPVKTTIDGGSYVQDKKSASNQLVKNGVVNNAYRFKFDGNTYVQLPKELASLGKDSTDFTIEGWFESNTTTKAYYFSKNSSTKLDNNLLIGESTDGNMHMQVGYKSGSYVSESYYLGDTIKGSRVHLVWTVKNNVLYYYENGTLKSTTDIMERVLWDDSFAPVLGADLDVATDGTGLWTDFFTGYMGEVRMYNRSLTGAEIKNNNDGNVVRTGLLAEYLFNEGSGSVINDSSGNGNDGQVMGNPVWEYEPNYRFKFDGHTYVQLPQELTSFGKESNNFTFEGWFESEPTSYAQFYYGKNGTDNGNNLLIGETGTPTYKLDAGSGSNSLIYNSNIAVQKNQKVHVVWTVENNVLKIYKNGVLEYTQTIEPRNNWDDNKAPQLGMDLDPTTNPEGNFFKGYMEQVRMYNRSLTETEIKNNKDGNVVRTGLLAEYLFSKGSGNIINDSSGNGYDGTVVGSTVWESYYKNEATFPETNPYDDGEYAGSLSKSGSTTSVTLSGSKINSDTKTVSSTKVITDYGIAIDGIDDKISTTRPIENDFTIESWIRTTEKGLDTQSHQHWLSLAIVHSESLGVMNDFGFGITSDGTLGYGSGKEGGGTVTGDNYTKGKTYVSDGQWHHLVVTRDSTTGKVKLYVDGQLDAEGTQWTGPLNAEPNIYLGYGNDAYGGTSYKLDVKEIRIWNKVLNTSEISHSKEIFVPNKTGLVTWWDFANFTNTKVTDKSGKGYDGIISGNPSEVNIPNKTTYNKDSYNGTLTKSGSLRLVKSTETANYATEKLIRVFDRNWQPTYSPTPDGYWKKTGEVQAQYVYVWHYASGSMSGGVYNNNSGDDCTYWTNAGGTWFSDNHCNYDWWDFYNNHGGNTSYDADVAGFIFKPTYITDWSWTKVKYEYVQDYTGPATKPGYDTRKYQYTQNYSGDVVRYITPTQVVANSDGNFPNSISYVDRSGFKGTIYKTGVTYLSSDGQYLQNYGGRVYSQTFDDREYQYTQYYTGTVESKSVDTRKWRADYSGTVYKGEYEELNKKYAYNVTINYSVITGTNACSYRHIAPTSNTTTNYLPKCISVDAPNNDLYKMLYNFNVSGISSTGE